MSVTSSIEIDREHWRRRPDSPVVMYQSWRRLLFVHWTADPDRVQLLLPPGLRVDTYAGKAWLGVVPFEMRNIRPRWLPAVPYVSNFLELNVRTYVVSDEGVPGVWFFSLNADRVLAVLLGRSCFGLPYFTSRMSCRTSADGQIDYRCCRISDGDQREDRYCYTPVGPLTAAVPGTLEFFLVERYVLFAPGRRGLNAGQVFHTPYPIQKVNTELAAGRLLQVDGLPQWDTPPEHALYSPGVDVEIFAPRSAGMLSPPSLSIGSG
ncbi:YqjF family protein [Planctomicrobium sp. SH664]|uniref:YqjF family protein n=1 Tax=Planctomicrobium sp. SH664 TaxID=3448125 RepID=UPI003F5C5DC9